MNWLIACDRTAADSLGGMTVTLIETGKSLLRPGDSVFWVTGRLNDSLPDTGVLEGLNLLSCPAYNIDFRSLLRLRSFFRSQVRRLFENPGIDAAIIHQPIAGEAIGPLLKEKGIPGCYFFHSPWAREFEVQSGRRGPRNRPALQLRSYLEDRAVRSFDRIAVFSETMTKHLLEEHPRASIPQRITPGIDLERFKPVGDREEGRRVLGWPDTGLIILTVRRLVPRMGVDLLIEAFRVVYESIPESHLLIGGEGPIEQDLREFASEHGVADRVHFLGYIPDEHLAEAYGTADLVVMPTRALEGLGLVTLEAMACGTGVVATPVGGNVELLELFRPELLAHDVSSEALAAVLQRVLSEGPGPLQHLGAEARSHVETNYGWDRAADDLRAILGFTE